MTMPSKLEEKCLKTAIMQLKIANTREKANNVCLSWKVFKNHPEFKEAISDKLEYFKKHDR